MSIGPGDHDRIAEVAAATSAPAGFDGVPRLPILDILRGIAILAILFANISDMGGSFYAAALGGNPDRLGWTLADRAAWEIRELLLSGTARGLLEMLFGAGMVILTDRAATRSGTARLLRGYVLRHLVLLLLGLAHVFVLLWPGDILHTYAVAALIAMCFRTARPRLMLSFGLLLAVFQLTFGGLEAVALARQHDDALSLRATRAAGRSLSAPERARLATDARYDADREAATADAMARIATEDRARSGTPRQWAWAAYDFFLFVQRRGQEKFYVLEAAGTMLIGAALYRWGILQGARSRRFYLSMLAIAYGTGLILRGLAIDEQLRAGLPLFGMIFGEPARLLTTLGHIALVNLLLTSAAGARLLKPFDAAGRTALSIYIAQTLICLWVLYPPWGLALYNRQGWAALMLTAAAINTLLLWGANIWVRYFAIAPVEWAWRSIVARQGLPFRLRMPLVGGSVRATPDSG